MIQFWPHFASEDSRLFKIGVDYEEENDTVFQIPNLKPSNLAPDLIP